MENSRAHIMCNGEGLKAFTLKVKNKMRMFSLISSSQHFTGSSCQGNQARKRNKTYPNWKRSKIEDNMILYVKDPKEYTHTQYN